VDRLVKVTDVNGRLCDVISIDFKLTGYRRGLEFKAGERGKFQSNISRSRCQLPIIVGDCLYVKITLIRRTDETASRTAYVNSSAAPLYGGSGWTDDHEIDVALARLSAYAMLSPRTRNVATAGLGFDMLPDDLQIQISVIDLSLQPL
jgi:hypothetical protein